MIILKLNVIVQGEGFRSCNLFLQLRYGAWVTFGFYTITPLKPKKNSNKTVRQLFWLWYCTKYEVLIHPWLNATCVQIHSIQIGWALKKLILAILGSHVVWSQKIRCGGIGVGGNAPLVCDPFVSIVACSKLKSQRPAILASRNTGKMVGRGCADPIPGISARSCFICRIQFWWQVIFGQVLAWFLQRNTLPCDLTWKWWFNSKS